MEGKGTTNAKYILGTFIEQALEEQKEVYVYFIDYTKSFDRAQYDEIITQLTQLKMKSDLRVTKNMFLEQAAAMPADMEISPFKEMKLSVK